MTDPIVAETDVYITRSFAAPRSVVWKFWTEPAQIVTWFGPGDFTVPIESVEIDLRVGGAWNLTMTDGTMSSPIVGTIVELVEEELLVVRLDAPESGVGALTDLTLRVQFHDHGDRTRITLHQGPFTAEARDMTAEGWEFSFVTIDSLLEGAKA